MQDIRLIYQTERDTLIFNLSDIIKITPPLNLYSCSSLDSEPALVKYTVNIFESRTHIQFENKL